MTFIANSRFALSVRNLGPHVSQGSIRKLVSIDVFRGLTMLLLIFGNDLWTIRDVPQRLGHVSSGVDGMVLADVVFPMFLFIVGLSIPFALERRLAQ
nr:DUF1624 domain-containing protein [Cytophagales bacterium]